ncbi:microtubule/calcium-binding protein [Pseudovirgaria hyperparasitica]|uniref:Translationally-controlled tumor protein homolog n=1 Tax=Pseudovirgaria hyperparasitica TaxID=470096 RepID=A0A6A6W1L0_9PEZI|nr:microtubule/calcium-binding protein [Pseudovirgaria hyperparasitica]KAF2756808.1 microtubule/calcium-binding protein [Pseudovirgaria hyperparasitica]
MLIYKDIITGDEIISDSYDLKEIDGVIYEADCKQITLGAVDVDIGANASAEGGDDEGVEDNAQTVIDVIHSFRLTEVPYGKASEYLSDLKKFMKKVKEALTEKGTPESEIKAFEQGAAKFAGQVKKNFKDWQFFMGESMNPEGLIVLLNYREDGVTPYVVVWKHGLTEMKV